MHNRTCSVDGCEQPKRQRGWCQAHYFRWRRTGDVGGPELQKKDGSHRCHIEGCERKHLGLGLCDRHFQRFQKWGDPYYIEEKPSGEHHPNWCGDHVGYTGAHDRVRGARGSASDHSCVACGGRAQQWAYDHADLDERYEYDVKGVSLMAYSAKIDHYRPMCIPCHKAFDLALVG